MDAYLRTEKKLFPYHDESQARKSKFLEQNGGGSGGGGGWVCQPIKVLRSRVYPSGQLPTKKNNSVLH